MLLFVQVGCTKGNKVSHTVVRTVGRTVVTSNTNEEKRRQTESGVECGTGGGGKGLARYHIPVKPSNNRTPGGHRIPSVQRKSPHRQPPALMCS